jgi:hypothetical protein
MGAARLARWTATQAKRPGTAAGFVDVPMRMVTWDGSSVEDTGRSSQVVGIRAPIPHRCVGSRSSSIPRPDARACSRTQRGSSSRSRPDILVNRTARPELLR